jgi:hypothetical protein
MISILNRSRLSNCGFGGFVRFGDFCMGIWKELRDLKKKKTRDLVLCLIFSCCDFLFALTLELEHYEWFWRRNQHSGLLRPAILSNNNTWTATTHTQTDNREKNETQKKILNLILHTARRTTLEKKKLGRWVWWFVVKIKAWKSQNGWNMLFILYRLMVWCSFPVFLLLLGLMLLLGVC